MFGFGSIELILIAFLTLGIAFLIWTTVYVVRKTKQIRELDSSIPKPWVIASLHLFFILILMSLYSVAFKKPALIYTLIGLTVYGWVPLYLILKQRKLKRNTPVEIQADESTSQPICGPLTSQAEIREPRTRLGGWVRVWIVFSVVWGILVFGYVAATTPSIFSIQAYWDEKIKAEEEILERKISGQAFRSDRTKEEVRMNIMRKALMFGMGEGRELLEYKEHREEELGQFWSKIIASTIIWLGALIASLLFGWSIGWMRRGFNK